MGGLVRRLVVIPNVVAQRYACTVEDLLFRGPVRNSDVNKDLTLKAKANAKDSAFKAKAKAKDRTFEGLNRELDI